MIRLVQTIESIGLTFSGLLLNSDYPISERRQTSLGYCINHPDRKTEYVCNKHQYYVCKDCLRCRDPELYCKFRSSCL